jgi:hypothetical protein
MNYDPTAEAQKLASQIMALKRRWQKRLPTKVAPESIVEEDYYEHQDHALWWVEPTPKAVVVDNQGAKEYLPSRTSTVRLNLGQKEQERVEHFEVRFVRRFGRQLHRDGTASLLSKLPEVHIKTKTGTVITTNLVLSHAIFLHLMTRQAPNPFAACGRQVELIFRKIGLERPKLVPLRVIGVVKAYRMERYENSVIVEFPDLEHRGRTKTTELTKYRLLRGAEEPDVKALEQMLEEFYDRVEYITLRCLEEGVSDRNVYALAQKGQYERAAQLTLTSADLSESDKEITKLGGVLKHLARCLKEYYAEE